MHKVICEMYLNDDFNVIMTDDIQENLYKLNMDTMKITHYDDRETLDDFLDDYLNASSAVVTSDFYSLLFDYTADSYYDTDDDFYMKAHDCLTYRKIYGPATELWKEIWK